MPTLTQPEAHYYEYRCEACEQKWLGFVTAERARCGFVHHIDPTQPCTGPSGGTER